MKSILQKLTTKQAVSLLILFGVMTLIDQASKIWAQQVLELENVYIPILSPYFELRYLRNYVPGWYSYVFYLAINLVLLPIMWYQYTLDPLSPKTMKIGLTLVYVGLFSNNLIDAFMFGYIRDFIYLTGFGVGNLADQFKYVGVIMTIYGGLKMEGYLQTPRQKLITWLIIIVIFVLIMRYFYGIIQI